jgi:2-succinyl-5-enolpyruvyl-6-hydroxy-3-cyclohexene-1-carboxylate synthase
MLDFRNLNTLWASVLVETLSRLGVTTAIICPGSRSAPLAIAFAQHPHIEAIPILDERSASFFALGHAKRTHTPVVLVCTSGTAGANFYPAVIEAHESRVPLLVLTADRPPELRDCNAGQAIDQQKLFGHYPNHAEELATPAVERLAYLRQRLLQAWRQTQYPAAGVVHLNVPLRDPLAPIGQPEILALAADWPADFFDHLADVAAGPAAMLASTSGLPLDNPRGVIIAGIDHPRDPIGDCQAIARLSQTLGYPVLAEGLSPVRHHAGLQPYLVSTYDLILRQPELAAALRPEVVIRIGAMPTSKLLREWLDRTQPRQWVIDPTARSLDPLHGRTVPVGLPIGSFAAAVAAAAEPADQRVDRPAYRHQWLAADAHTRARISQTFEAEPRLIESKIAWTLADCLPIGTAVFVANSMPVRDVEWFWQASDRRYQLLCNRGANGIDGTLSTALGIAHSMAQGKAQGKAQSGPPTVLLTGDLSLLHDTNGFLIGPQLRGHLTIVLVNNHGGGIFGMLPIAQFDPPFEDFFATPQSVDFEPLCRAYGVEYQRVEDWDGLRSALSEWPNTGIRVLEVRTDRQSDAAWRKAHLGQFAAGR